MSFIESLENVEKTFEKTGNILGHVPVVSTASGICRLASGQLQFDFGVTAAVLSVIASAFCSGDNKIACRTASARLGEQALHGIANMVRGTVETIPLINLLTIPYDMTFNRIGYTSEYTDSKTSPIPNARDLARTILPAQLIPASAV